MFACLFCVEEVNGYLDAIRECRDNPQLEGNALLNLSDKVRPPALGANFKSRQRIRDIAGKCSEKLYDILKKLRKSFAQQMELRAPYDPSTLARPGENTNHAFARAVIKCNRFGVHKIVSCGQAAAIEMNVPNSAGGTMKQTAFRDQKEFEGWRENR